MVSNETRFSPEETLAAFTSQGVEVVACGSVSAHCAVLWLIFLTDHGFRFGDDRHRFLSVRRLSGQFWVTLGPVPSLLHSVF